MKKSLQHLFIKVGEKGTKEGFKVLKNIRGGNFEVDPVGVNNHCENSGTCANSNTDCANSGNCTNTTNSGSRGCSNYICFS